jgi:two-component system chemotaxis response regulator CheB
MNPIRILVVDDSVVIRKVLSDTLAEDRALEAVGVAGDGRIALTKIPVLKPDLITLDIETPVMNGLQALEQLRKVNSCRPAVDMLFRSVAVAYGANVLGVVMTGMGTDGVLGAHEIRDAGGDVIIQDHASAVVWGMPGAVHSLGLADGAYPLDQLAAEITRRVRPSRGAGAPVEVGSRSSLEPSEK